MSDLEFKKLVKNLQLAQNHYDYAIDFDEILIAIQELDLAQARLNHYIKYLKSLKMLDDSKSLGDLR